LKRFLFDGVGRRYFKHEWLDNLFSLFASFAIDISKTAAISNVLRGEYGWKMIYSREVAAAKLGISGVQLWRWQKVGKFPAPDIRDGAKVFWPAKLFNGTARRLIAARRAKLRAQLAALDGAVLT
jgi:hypothetical protein